MFTSIDLFAGAGGLSTGLTQAGFQPLFASELHPKYAAAYALNHQETDVAVDDIRQVDARDVRTRFGLKPGDLDLLAGGPPCQGFSINAPVRSNKDPRNHLFREFLRFAEEFMPRAILIENVPGLVSFERGRTLAAIISSLEEYGYHISVKIMSAAYHGVPQTRWRTIIVGTLNSHDEDSFWPQPTHYAQVRANFSHNFQGKDILEKPADATAPLATTLYDAISDLPLSPSPFNAQSTIAQYNSPASSVFQQQVRADSTGVYNHFSSNLSGINLERLSHIPPGGNWTNIPHSLLPAGMQRARKSDHTKRYGRPRWSDLSGTILTKCDPHWGAFFHPSADRVFTVREAARIQSFPDTYHFTGALADQYAEVGNAVPPMLAQAIGSQIAGHLRSA